MAKIGVLTGGGDCPGQNAVIAGIVVRAGRLGRKIVGFRRGWQGLLDGGQPIALDAGDVEDIHLAGGSILGVSRVNPFEVTGGKKQVLDSLERHGCDSLIAIGGDHTLKIASRFAKLGVDIVGIPKTLDNNLALTDYTFGFATACNIAADAVERLQTSAKSRESVIVVEVLGDSGGWIALFSGLASGAQAVLVPEVPFDLKDVSDIVKRRRKVGKGYSVVVVAEGALPKSDRMKKDLEKSRDAAGGLDNGSGIAAWLAAQLQKRCNTECVSVVLGHIQRAGTPTAFDRVLGMRLGAKGVDLVEGKEFATMAAVHGTRITSVPLAQAVKTNKTIPPKYFDRMKMFFD